MDDKESKRKFKIRLGIALIVIGPLLLTICPLVTLSLGYNMFSWSSHISASEPHFYTISAFIYLWVAGIPITIVGSIIGALLIAKQKKKKKKK